MSFYHAKLDFNLKEHPNRDKAGKGILMLGAGEGREHHGVIDLNPLHVLWVDAIKDKIHNLKQTLLRYSHQLAENVVLADKKETRMFYEYSPWENNSLYEIGPAFKKYFGHVKQIGKREVETETLDGLLKRLGIAHEHCNMLVMSVQGAELPVLKGASKLLRSGHVTHILTDILDDEFYKGGTRRSDLIKYLEDELFVLEKEYRHDEKVPISYGVFVKLDEAIEEDDTFEEENRELSRKFDSFGEFE